MPDSPESSVPQPSSRGVVAVYRSKGQLVVSNFLGGLAWGFGSVLGATIVAALLLILLKTLGGLPLIGSYINEVSHTITTTRR